MANGDSYGVYDELRLGVVSYLVKNYLKDCFARLTCSIINGYRISHILRQPLWSSFKNIIQTILIPYTLVYRCKHRIYN